MESKVYGYARVSTTGQNEDRQVAALLAYGVQERNIIIDKASGRDFDRAGYQSLKSHLLREGDTLVVKELDRLSRNRLEMQKELMWFREHGIRIKILEIPTTLTDFGDEQGWVLDMVNNILIDVLGSIAESERTKIRTRQREGIDIARRNGKQFGRPRLALPDGWAETIRLVDTGEMKAVDAMWVLGLKKSAYYLLRKRYHLTNN